jgi:hypothetical protein
MVYHILNGDALASFFPEARLEGNLIVMREGLIDGNLAGEELPDFWQARAQHHGVAYEEYHNKVVTELEKIMAAPDGSQFHLWFGYDLFCQANMWFTLSLIHDLPINKEVFVVYPTFLAPKDIWKEFGAASAEDLRTSFTNRVRFRDSDLHLGKDLWTAYKHNELRQLEELSHTESPCFPYLREAVRAHIDRFPTWGAPGRPQRVIEAIIRAGTSGFYPVFEAFHEREGVYGFGDVQFRKLYDNVLAQR